MADITLKNLGDIPVVEPDDSTHLLAEQDGAYARVPKDKVGVTSWNELEDKPFGEETGRGVLYDKTVTDDSYNQYLDANAPFAFVEGETYEVAVSNRSDDGEDITVEFVAASNTDGFVGYDGGNLYVRTKSVDGVNALICTLTGSTQKTYDLKISGPKKVLVPLDNKFLDFMRFDERVIVEEQTVNFDGSGGMYQGQAVSVGSIAVGDVVRVLWDGEEYVCKAYVVPEMGSGDPMVGNAGLMAAITGMNLPYGNGEPFFGGSMNGVFMLMTTDASATHTVSVKRERWSLALAPMTVNLSVDGETYSVDRSFAEINEEIARGMPVRLKFQAVHNSDQASEVSIYNVSRFYNAASMEYLSVTFAGFSTRAYVTVTVAQDGSVSYSEEYFATT